MKSISNTYLQEIRPADSDIFFYFTKVAIMRRQNSVPHIHNFLCFLVNALYNDYI